MNNAVAVALKRGTDGVLCLVPDTTAAVAALGRLRGEELELAGFEIMANRRHRALAVYRRMLGC
jgi:hypothetical protein